MRTLFGAGDDWPISYDDLERYYEIVERLVGVAGPANNPFRPRSLGQLMSPHGLSYASTQLKSGFAAIGAHLIPNTLAILSRSLGNRPACNYCNSCSFGCPTGDKGSADVTFLPLARATGRLEMVTQATVLTIETDNAGRLSGVVYADSKGTRSRIATKAILLGAGTIETARLLLLSESSKSRNGLSNSSGEVGRNLTETLFWVSVGLHPRRLDSFGGVPIDGSAWDFAVPTSQHGYMGGYRLATAHGAAGLRGPVSYARAGHGFGVTFQQQIAKEFGHGVAVMALGEWLPNEQTRVELDDKLKDSHGQPIARITSFLGQNERALIQRMADQVRTILKASGVKEIVSERSALDQFHATHVLGTCRFGADRQTSVADSDGLSHDVPGLGFVDGSVLPSSGAGDSPFLTISALAVRTADRLMASLKQGT